MIDQRTLYYLQRDPRFQAKMRELALQRQKEVESAQNKSENNQIIGTIAGLATPVALNYGYNKLTAPSTNGSKLADLGKTTTVPTSTGATASTPQVPTTNVYNNATQQAWNSGADLATQNSTVPTTQSTSQTPQPIQEQTNDYMRTAGRVGQGALGAYQAYNGYQQIQGGDAVGGGLNMASGTANMASAAGSQTAGQVTPYLASAAAVASGDQAARKAMGRENAGFEATRGAGLAVADWFTGGLASAAAGLAHKQWGGTEKKIRNFQMNSALSKYTGGQALHKFLGGLYTKKSEDQAYRDLIRKDWKEKGLVDDKYNLGFNDGTKLQIGIDGNKFSNSEKGKIDYSKYGDLVATSDSLAGGLGLTGKAKNALSYLATRGALEGTNNDKKKQMQRLGEIASKYKLDQTSAKTNFDNLLANKKINQNEYDIGIGKLGELFSGVPKTSSSHSPGFDKNGKRIFYNNKRR